MTYINQFTSNYPPNQAFFNDFLNYPQEYIKRLPDCGKKFLNYIMGILLHNKHAFPSIETIFKETGISERSAYLYRAKFEEDRVFVVLTTNGRSNEYVPNPYFYKNEFRIWAGKFISSLKFIPILIFNKVLYLSQQAISNRAFSVKENIAGDLREDYLNYNIPLSKETKSERVTTYVDSKLTNVSPRSNKDSPPVRMEDFRENYYQERFERQKEEVLRRQNLRDCTVCKNRITITKEMTIDETGTLSIVEIKHCLTCEIRSSWK